VPARDEAETVGETIGALLRQDYRGPSAVVLVDDQSGDGTARLAREAAAAFGAGDRLEIVSGRPLPAGWTGKLWAQSQGVDFAANAANTPDYLLLTDADIVFAPGALSSLVARAEQDGLVLNSLMVKLRCKSFAERMFVPAFVFFFQMLYPFAWVNDPRRATAGAAGGCVLVKREGPQAAGGPAAVRRAPVARCGAAETL